VDLPPRLDPKYALAKTYTKNNIIRTEKIQEIIWNIRETLQKRLLSVEAHVFKATAPTPRPKLGKSRPEPEREPDLLAIYFYFLASEFLQLGPCNRD